MKNISPVKTQQYIEKADHFLQGMKLLNDDVPNYRSGIGLLAVHSAISLNDAVTVGLTGKRKAFQDHAMAARDLEKRDLRQKGRGPLPVASAAEECRSL